MPAFDEAFNAAYNTQLRANQQAAERKEREARAAWEREDRAYRDSERKRIGDARATLENTISGMGAGAQADIGAAGYTPDQIATGMRVQGGAKPFAEQVAKYQGDFDSSDLQSGGAGARVASGLPLQGGKIDPSSVKAPRKSELAGARARYALAMGQDPGAALADQEKAQSEERMKDWFAQFSHLSPGGLLEHPMLAGMLNGNTQVRGAVGLAKDGKTFIVADYNGSGTAEEFSRDELMQAAYQRFLESEGRVPESIALGLGRTDRKRARNREDAQDSNKGQELAFGINLGNKKYALAEREFDANNAYRNSALGLQREGLKLRRDEMNRTHPVMSPEDRGSLLKIEEAWYSAKDPVAKAELGRQYQMTLSRAALGMGKVLGLPNDRAAQKPLTIEDAAPLIDRLQADPAHKGKNVFELYRMVQAEMGGGAPETFKVPGGEQPAPAKPAGLPQRPVSDGRTNFGALTSRADLEREAAAGNPHAIRYMDVQRQNRINAELGANNPNYGVDY